MCDNELILPDFNFAVCQFIFIMKQPSFSREYVVERCIAVFPKSFPPFLSERKGAYSRQRRIMKKEYNPPFYFPVEAAQNIYASDNIYLRTDALVIFTCGANSSDVDCIRERFLRYSDKYFDAGFFFVQKTPFLY